MKNDHPVDLTEAVEERVVEQLGRVAVHERHETFVAFAVEGRENVDQDAEYGSADQPLLVGTVDLFEEGAHPGIDRGEVVGHQPAEDTQQDEKRNLVEPERIVGSQRDGDDRIESPDREGDGGGRDRRDQQRYDRARGEIEHQDFEHEDHARDRGFEDGCKGRPGSAAEQQGGVFVVQVGQAADVRTDGCARQDDRGLGTDRTAESDRCRTAYDRSPAVVGGNVRVFTRHGI